MKNHAPKGSCPHYPPVVAKGLLITHKLPDCARITRHPEVDLSVDHEQRPSVSRLGSAGFRSVGAGPDKESGSQPFPASRRPGWPDPA